MDSLNSTKHLRINYQLSTIFSKVKAKEIVSNSYYKIRIILIPKSDENIIKKRKSQSNINYEHKYKNPKQNLANRI